MLRELPLPHPGCGVPELLHRQHHVLVLELDLFRQHLYGVTRLALGRQVAQVEPDLQTKLQEVNAMLSGSPNSLEVREEETFWRSIDAITKDWQQQLLTWANNAQETLKMLDAEEPAARAVLVTAPAGLTACRWFTVHHAFS